MKKGDLSNFVEDAVRWRMFDRRAQALKDRNQDVPARDLEAEIDRAVRAARKAGRRRAVTWRGESDASEALLVVFGVAVEGADGLLRNAILFVGIPCLSSPLGLPPGYYSGRMKLPDSMTLTELRDRLRHFAAQRDWEKYHSPKNLASALIVEAAELLERFQWLTGDESKSLPPAELAKVREEIADVLIYVVRLADQLDIDLLEAAREKMDQNALKYPADKARGNNRKYSDL
jgi:dCTP diphosphatase